MHMFSFQTKTSGHAWSVWVCILLAIAAFFWVVGPLALNPQNVAWLDGGFDPAQHYLGWVFFRNSAWSFPLGLNPAFGMDISSSIVYSDSIPLLAFLFKPFAAFLPETFQYFGLWLLLCFILQSYFAWRLTALLQMPSIATISAVILLTDPQKYEGGELQVVTNGNIEQPMTFKPPAGSVVFFASWMPHRVVPVQKGIRKSLVAWIMGKRVC